MNISEGHSVTLMDQEKKQDYFTTISEHRWKHSLFPNQQNLPKYLLILANEKKIKKPPTSR